MDFLNLKIEFDEFWDKFCINSSGVTLVRVFMETTGQKMSDLTRQQIQQIAFKCLEMNYANTFNDRFNRLIQLGYVPSAGFSNLYNAIRELKNPESMLKKLENDLATIIFEREKAELLVNTLRHSEQTIIEQIADCKKKIAAEEDKKKTQEYLKIKARRQQLEEELAELKEKEKAFE